MKQLTWKYLVIAIVLVIVIIWFGCSTASEPYGETVTESRCLEFVPGGARSGPYSTGQQYANAYACQYGRKRWEKDIHRGDCPGGVCYNPIDFTGCSWFLPPDHKPADVSEEEFTKAWANYWACVDEETVGERSVARSAGTFSNNLDFGGFKGDVSNYWPGRRFKYLNKERKSTWDSNVGESRGLTGEFQRLWLLGVRNPKALRNLIDGKHGYISN